jgi:hypothetical protein
LYSRAASIALMPGAQKPFSLKAGMEKGRRRRKELLW